MVWKCFCNSKNLQIDYDDARQSRNNGKWKVPVRCKDCGQEFTITKHGQFNKTNIRLNPYRKRVKKGKIKGNKRNLKGNLNLF